MNKPGFGWRPITAGERLPLEYIYWDGLAWTHKRNSTLCGEHWETVPNLDQVHVRMTQEEIANVEMSWELWDSLSADERFLYNKPAMDLLGKGVLEVWSGHWQSRLLHGYASLQYPLRPYKTPPEKLWYLLKYPDGSVIGFETEEMARHAAIGQDVSFITTRECSDVGIL